MHILVLDRFSSLFEGNAMYAEVPAAQLAAKGPLLEGGIYMMSQFRVSKAKSFYKPVNANYMIGFTFYTKITPAKGDPTTFPALAYTLVPFADLDAYAGHTKQFLECPGHCYSHERCRRSAATKLGCTYPVQGVIIRDLSGNELTLWGQSAIEVKC
ncbi:hypothetical protein ACP4OV_016597 [Aristida adscensionis]